MSWHLKASKICIGLTCALTLPPPLVIPSSPSPHPLLTLAHPRLTTCSPSPGGPLPARPACGSFKSAQNLILETQVTAPPIMLDWPVDIPTMARDALYMGRQPGARLAFIHAPSSLPCCRLHRDLLPSVSLNAAAGSRLPLSTSSASFLSHRWVDEPPQKSYSPRRKPKGIREGPTQTAIKSETERSMSRRLRRTRIKPYGAISCTYKKATSPLCPSQAVLSLILPG